MQKDAVIRELNDRLYFGADKFQEYLVSSRRKHEMLKEHARRTKSYPVRYQVTYEPSQVSPVEGRDSGYSSGGGYARDEYPHRGVMEKVEKAISTPRTHYEEPTMELNVRNLATSLDRHDLHNRSEEHMVSPLKPKPPIFCSKGEETVIIHTDNHLDDNIITTPYTKDLRIPSPNNDSAIENPSPSSASSDRDSFSETGHQTELGKDGRHKGLELDSIRTNIASKSQSRTDSYHSYRSGNSVRSYYVDGVAVSQI